MKITFEKRVYNIEDGEERYEITRIIKSPDKKYNKTYSSFLKYEKSDFYCASGFHYFEPSDELISKIKNQIKKYES
jgi:hypothetical protein